MIQAGNAVDNLGGKADGKNKRTMKLVSATSKTRRVTSFDVKEIINFPIQYGTKLHS